MKSIINELKKLKEYEEIEERTHLLKLLFYSLFFTEINFESLNERVEC